MPFAVVGLGSYSDSVLLKFEVTDEKGFFEFEAVAPGHYFLKVSSTGFQEFISPPFEVSDAAAQHQIVLSALQNGLEQVTVSATKPVIESLPDRLIFNVGQLISASGGNAFDLFSQAPGVTLSSDGLVNLRGKSNVLVLVDNRENFIQGENLATFLKGLPADQILSLEIITRPSAKYAASGTGGIINIKTKKYAHRGFGINVSSGLRQGINFNTNNNLAVSWRNEKLYVFANYGYVRNGVYHKLKMSNTFLGEQGKTLSQTEQVYEVSLKNNINSVQTGIDFTHKKTFLGISYSGIFENHLPRSQATNTDIFNASHQLIEKVRGERLRTRNVSRNTVNFNYVRSFARPGSELTVATDFFNYDLDMHYSISNAFHRLGTGSDTMVNFIQTIPNTMKVYSAKADFTYPLSESSTFQIGLRSSFSRMNNVYNFSLLDPATRQYRFDPVRSIHYTFNEDIHSGYINFLHIFSETFDIEAGLRLENTSNTSVEKHTKDLLEKSYTRLFPNFMINYNPGENHSYSLGYSRRFNRPEYTTLIPAYLYTDLLYYVYGNPHQDPEMSDNADLSYIFMGKLTANVNISFLDRMFFTAFIANPENHAIGETTINHGRQRSAAFSIDYSDQLRSWYSLTLSSTLGHRKTETGEEKNIAKGYYFQGQMNNRFSLGKGWSAEVAGVFTSGQYESFEYYLNRFGYMVLGLGKTLFKGKGSIKVQMRDPFYSMVYDYDTRFPAVTQKWVLRQDSRQVGLAFSYRFASGNETKTRSRITSNEEEKERYKE